MIGITVLSCIITHRRTTTQVVKTLFRQGRMSDADDYRWSCSLTAFLTLPFGFGAWLASSGRAVCASARRARCRKCVLLHVTLKLFTLLDLCVSSLREGHANILCIVPMFMDDPRRESRKCVLWVPVLFLVCLVLTCSCCCCCLFMHTYVCISIYIYIYIYIYTHTLTFVLGGCGVLHLSAPLCLACYIRSSEHKLAYAPS